jgi:hypothetical protein
MTVLHDLHIILSVHIDGEELAWEQGNWQTDDARARAAEVLRQAATAIELGG